jgi:two-component system CheB/CheR fusion protein
METKMRVLVIDDNLDAAESMRDLLLTNGYDALAAFDGDTALELAMKMRPTVVISDIVMPGIDGLEVCRRLRRQPNTRSVVMVALSGWANMKEAAIHAGFDRFLLKPLLFENLRPLLDSLRLQLC